MAADKEGYPDRKHEDTRGWLGGAKVSCIFCHPGRPADIGL